MTATQLTAPPRLDLHPGLYSRTDAAVHDGMLTETFAPVGHLASPWSPRMQHGGPVAALLTRAMDRCQPRPDTRLARIHVDLLGPVPMDQVRVTARVERPGRRIELLSATLDAPDPAGRWRPAARASAWRLATQPTGDVVNLADARRHLPGEDSPDLHDHDLPDSWRVGGFVEAITWRVEHLGTSSGDPTIAWTNLEHPLVDSEHPTDLERLVAVADTTNGIGARLDPAHFTFLNCDLTVHLHQPPAGAWYGLQAETSVGADGIGMSAAVIHTEHGPIGRVTQTVLVERRPDPQN